MATNDFKPFSTGTGANVVSQADYLALSALLTGFQSGKASSAQVNKAIRQGTTIAALVGQFIANAGADALDNGDISGLVTKFTNALNANLNLKTAALRDVGTGTNQIPDMASFSRSLTSGNWWQRLPGGLIIQGGFSPTSNPPTVQDVNISFPIAFPNRMLWIGEHDQALALGVSAVWGFQVGQGAVTTGLTASQIGTLNRGVSTMALPTAASCSYVAIGY